MKKITVKKWTTREITYIGIMAAAVYAASAFLQIPIPTVIGSTRLHMGNVMCLLAGMLLGSVQGGLAAGIGSMLFDLTNPAYVASAPFTFCFKFAMAWICGAVIWSNKSTCISKMPRCWKVGIHIRQRYLMGSVAGSFAYVLCYLLKNFVEHHFVLGLPLQAVLLMIAQKAAVSGINAVVACIVAVPLGLALRHMTAFRSQT